MIDLGHMEKLTVLDIIYKKKKPVSVSNSGIMCDS